MASNQNGHSNDILCMYTVLRCPYPPINVLRFVSRQEVDYYFHSTGVVLQVVNVNIVHITLFAWWFLVMAFFIF